jgi:hypothetical protein
VALFHTIPLAGIFVIWLATYGQSSAHTPDESPSAATVVDFVWTGVSTTFRSLGQLRFAGWILAVLLVTGLVVAILDDRRAFPRLRAVPLALAVGAVVYLASTGLGRVGEYGAVRATLSRYLYVVAVMALPVVALACSALVRRWRFLAPVVVVVLLAGLAGNIELAREPLLTNQREFLLTVPRVPMAGEVPDSVRPLPILGPEITVGWLKDAVASGRLPEPADDRAELEAANVNLAVSQSEGPTPQNCVAIADEADLHLDQGESRSFIGQVEVRRAGPERPAEAVVLAHWVGGTRLTANVPVDLVLRRSTPALPASLCD